MSILDTEEMFPTPNFWKERGFLHVRNRPLWCWVGTMLLHYKMEQGGVHYGNVRIKATYNEISNLFEVEASDQNVFILPIPGEFVRFEPIKLNNPSQREIEMVMNKSYLSTRIENEHF